MGQAWLRLTTPVIGPSEPPVRNTPSTAPTPSGVQNGRRPSTCSSCPISLEPTTAPSALTSEPLALSLSPGIWAMAVTASG